MSNPNITSKKLYDVSHNARFDFILAEVQEWLERQALHQIHISRPKFIQYASFNDIQDLNEVHQSDTTPMPHDKVGNQIYKYRSVIKDVATRYQCSFALTDKFSAQMAKAIQKIYNDSNNPFNYPKTFISNRGMSPNETVKHALKSEKIIAKPAVKHRKPIGYSEFLLPSNVEVHHLLEPENQPVLYKLYNGPKHSFVLEELQIIPPDTMLSSRYILKH
ncbi:1571_t:CDS:2 [Ambispora gerdemannii]|uniref:1571_t:CDS:1 n=1 Tax=Ambispora gerdemannii TaxID=144530 RepID=A0A9N9GF62_9GLOM|nr:1571_t:CDS:2 [Ambispora gerdemannii]